jgi:group I intron endonuclease
MIGIYKITNPENKIYIGCTTNWERRLYEYENLKVKGQSLIYESLIKFGWVNHKFEIIEECLVEELYEKEIYWINNFNSVINGLNLRVGGRNGTLTQNTKDKISQSLKGRKNTWNKKGLGIGRKCSQETIDKMKDRKYSEESKQKMRKPRIKRWKRETLVIPFLIEEIRTKYETGNFTRSDLSREYGVSWGTIKNITDKINSYKDIIG